MKTETKQTHIEATIRKVRAIAGLCECEDKIVLCSLHLAAPDMLVLLKEIEESPVGSAKNGLEFKIRQLIAKAEGK